MEEHKPQGNQAGQNNASALPEKISPQTEVGNVNRLEAARINHLGIISSRQLANEEIYNLGILLLECKEEEYWRDHGYGTFGEYLASPEVGCSKSAIGRVLQVTKTFCLEEGMTPKDIAGYSRSNLVEIASTYRSANKETKKALLSEAKELSQSDLQANIKERQGKKTPAQMRYESGFSLGVYVIAKMMYEPATTGGGEPSQKIPVAPIQIEQAALEDRAEYLGRLSFRLFSLTKTG